jgi:hypothetical protein
MKLLLTLIISCYSITLTIGSISKARRRTKEEHYVFHISKFKKIPLEQNAYTSELDVYNGLLTMTLDSDNYLTHVATIDDSKKQGEIHIPDKLKYMTLCFTLENDSAVYLSLMISESGKSQHVFKLSDRRSQEEIFDIFENKIKFVYVDDFRSYLQRFKAVFEHEIHTKVSEKRDLHSQLLQTDLDLLQLSKRQRELKQAIKVLEEGLDVPFGSKLFVTEKAQKFWRMEKELNDIPGTLELKEKKKQELEVKTKNIEKILEPLNNNFAWVKEFLKNLEVSNKPKVVIKKYS